jgi:prepilin-type N-terminal cleavage/methylation domain-containing protein
MKTSKLKNRKGFTLIELMISMFIGLIVFGGVFTTFKNQKLLYSRQEKIIKINQDTRAALSIIKNYVKKGGISVPNCSPVSSTKKCTGLAAIGTNYFVVTSDLDLNGALPTTFTSIVDDLEIVSFVKGGDESLYICPGTITSSPESTTNCQFILDNVSKFDIKACSTETGGSNAGTTTCSASPTDNSKIDSIQVTLQAETKDTEITENNVKLIGSEITARIFFINKTFQ